MVQLDMYALQSEWQHKERLKLTGHKRPDDKPKRRYPHFDPFVGASRKTVADIFDPAKMAVFGFYPLIKSVLEEKRWQRDKDTGYRYYNLKPREIYYAAHRDALAYSWYGFLLGAMYDDLLEKEGVSESVIAYRALGKSTPEHVRDVTDFIRKKRECDVLCMDVTSFFDTIDHPTLKRCWSYVIEGKLVEDRLPEDHFHLFRQVTGYRYVTREDIEKRFGQLVPGKTAKKSRYVIDRRNGKYLPNDSLIELVVAEHRKLKRADIMDGIIGKNEGSGIPQGLPISGVLANISMIELDMAMHALAVSLGGIYRRYSDDIIFVVDAGKSIDVENELVKRMTGLNLKISQKKTERRQFRVESKGNLVCLNPNEKGRLEPLQYLGIEFDGEWHRLRSKSVAKFWKTVAQTVSKTKHMKTLKGAKVIRHRQFFKKFTSMSESSNFLTYAKVAHAALYPHSKIASQISDDQVRVFIKTRVARPSARASAEGASQKPAE